MSKELRVPLHIDFKHAKDKALSDVVVDEQTKVLHAQWQDLQKAFPVEVQITTQ